MASTAPPLADLVSLEQLAQRVFAELYREILTHEAGVRAGDIEAIHRMRIATRRMRVALSNFAVCWARAERQQVKTWCQALADVLGATRDLDVLIETVKTMHADLPSETQQRLQPATVKVLLGRLRRQRKNHLKNVLVFLDGKVYRNFKTDFPRLLKLDA